VAELAKQRAMVDWVLVQPYSTVGKLSNKNLETGLSPKLTAIKQRDTAVDHRVFSRIAR
jgi:hypothetical protein